MTAARALVRCYDRRAMRGVVLLGAVVVSTACSSNGAPTQTLVETDNPNVPGHFVGSASFSRELDQVVLSVTNVEGGSSCDPTNVAATSNVANVLSLKLRVSALSSSGDILPGTYSNGTATFTITDSSCANAVGEITSDTTVTINVSADGINGWVRAHFPGTLFVVNYVAHECGPPTPSDAGTSCVSLPSCPAGDAGTASLCIDFP